MNLAVVVNIGRSESSTVLVVLSIVRGHGWINGGIPRAGKVVEHGGGEGSSTLDEESHGVGGFRDINTDGATGDGDGERISDRVGRACPSARAGHGGLNHHVINARTAFINPGLAHELCSGDDGFIFVNKQILTSATGVEIFEITDDDTPGIVGCR